MTLLSVRDLYAESRVGRWAGPQSWDYFWLAAYLFAVSLVVSRTMLLANLLAVFVGVAVCGTGFAASVSLWAVCIVLTLRFPWTLGVAGAVLWLLIIAVSVQRSRKERLSLPTVPPNTATPDTGPPA
ncbi:MAG: hypothetical protein NTZ56_23310 [Acidobacteria bacterium]|nr:hypothetical protein [Acidobacteriota bacterium]